MRRPPSLGLRRYRTSLLVTVVVAVVGIVVTLLVGGGSPTNESATTTSLGATHGPTTPSTVAATEIVRVAPFVGHNQLASDLRATTFETSGQCDQFSGASDRLDATRCWGESGSYDPCFVFDPVVPDNVVCIDPWTPDVALFLHPSFDGPLLGEEITDTATAMPFAIELEDGDHCRRSWGMAFWIGGSLNAFDCESGAVVVWPLDRSEAHWIAIVWTGTLSRLTPVGIRTAFF